MTASAVRPRARMRMMGSSSTEFRPEMFSGRKRMEKNCRRGQEEVAAVAANQI
jgi:hypothetical protein